MAGPPADAKPSELWLKLSERPRPTTVVPFPVKEGAESPGNLRLRILTESELHNCRADAEKTAEAFTGKSAKDGGLGYEDIFRNECAVQLVVMAARDEADPNCPAFPSAKLARRKLTTDEFAVIARAYSLYRVEAGPALNELSVAEMDAWIRVLKEGGSRLPLARCSTEALTDLVMYLVSKVASSPTDSGSAGSPPDEPYGATSPADLVDDEEKMQR